jgi:hypothetical protein
MYKFRVAVAGVSVATTPLMCLIQKLVREDNKICDRVAVLADIMFGFTDWVIYLYQLKIIDKQ